MAMSSICRVENYVCGENIHGGGKSAHGGEESVYRKTRGHEIEKKTRAPHEGRIYAGTRGGLSSGSTRTLT